METNTTRSAFDKNSVQDWIAKNSYKGGYDDQLYKHKSKTKPVAKKTVVKTKPVMRPKKKNMIDAAIAEHKRVRKPYNLVNKMVK